MRNRRAIPAWAHRLACGAALLAGCLTLVASLPAAAQEDGISYDVTVSYETRDGSRRRMSGEFREAVRASASLISLADEPPPTLLGLQRRANADRQRLQTTLRALGYYNGSVRITVSETGPDQGKAVITVVPGPRYTVRQIAIEPADGAQIPPTLALTPEMLPLRPGDPATGRRIVDAETPLQRAMRERGYAFAELGQRRVIVDHSDRSVDVTYRVRPGQAVAFGETTISGLESVSAELVRGRIRWEPGASFDASLVDRTRRSISDLGVFSTVRVRHADTADSQGRLAMEIIVAERAPRFVGGSASLSTDRGVGLTAFWGHRNLLGAAERLRISGEADNIRAPLADLTRIGLRAGVNLRKPDFLRVDQALITQAELLLERRPGFERRAVTTSAEIERVLTPTLTLRTGVAVDIARVDDSGASADDDAGFERSTTYSLPTSVTEDRRNDRLNATSGYYLRAAPTPVMRRGETTRYFVTNQVEARYYRDLAEPLGLEQGRIALATRLGLGATLRPTGTDIPAERRFYTGGAQTVRGYGFESLGPLDDSNDPEGGASEIRTALELRARAANWLGIAAFLDGGNVFAPSFPPSNAQLRWGGGGGVRYFSPVGPIRLDLGFPLTPRGGIDDPIQVYISVGQAF